MNSEVLVNPSVFSIGTTWSTDCYLADEDYKKLEELPSDFAKLNKESGFMKIDSENEEYLND